MKKTVVMVFAALLLLGKSTFGQNEMFKALYIYNFQKNISWPDEYKSGDFVIGVLGSTPVLTELLRLSKKKQAGNQIISIQKYSSVSEIGKCNILYIPTQKSSEFDAVRKKLENNSTLLITDKAGLAQKGAMINFVTIDGDQKFEINPKQIALGKLKVNSFLTSLGIVIN